MEDSGWGVRFLKGSYADALPHLHTHIVPRYADDPVPGHLLPFDFLDNQRQPEDRLQADVLALRTAVDSLEP
jgi:diadenosine tetraphosphate (Ap4A) HIT family hydrolase